MTIDINDTDMQKGITFLSLIKKQNIQIPIIQRDYAQGRLNRKATEIRDGFLTALIEPLIIDEAKPLVLDFVYGSTNINNIFVPLDGQQRLTTLFLLHWYLAADENLSIFRIQESNSAVSKFTYETRISSKDFCNKLVTRSFNSIKACFEEYISSFNSQIKNVEEKITELEANVKSIEAKIVGLLESKERKNETNKLKGISETIKELEAQLKQLGYAKQNWKISTTIKNQSWFIWSWRKDPTITAMLVMLDEMDSRLGNFTEDIRKSMWSKLEVGKIIFHLLPLEKFDLTDELYVKMNARGKELSKFDIFKSTLEEQMRLNEVSEKTQNKWRNNVDNNWIDLFWNKLAKPKLANGISEEEQIKCVNSVEDSYLRFLKRMMVYHLFINDDCFQCNWDDENIKRSVPFKYEEASILNLLRDFSVRNDVMKLMPLFSKTKFLSQNFFDFVINSFDNLIYQEDEEKYDGSELIENIYFETNPKTIFEAFIYEDITYDTRVQFFALLQFFSFKKAIDIAGNVDLKTEFNSWMRIIRNLSTNTNTNFYNGYDDFLKSLIAIKKWAEEIYSDDKQGSVYYYFENQKPQTGFNTEQLKEESIKASLIKSSAYNNDWFNEIKRAEEHVYFLGQIRFLLKWSLGSDNEIEKYSIAKFKDYLNKICCVFGNNGLIDSLCRPDTHLFRNALMANHSYYLYKDSFIENTGKSRDWSWKRYLRESVESENVKKMLDKWDEKQVSLFKDFCENEIKTNISDWRKYFIEKPEIYNELYSSRIGYWSRESPDVSLLSKTNWRSKHKELRTYYWYLKYRLTNDKYLISKDETNPFSAVFNRENSNEFSVKFIPRWINGIPKCQYVVSSNYDPQMNEFLKNDGNNRWEKYFDSDKSDDVQAVLESLNSGFF